MRIVCGRRRANRDSKSDGTSEARDPSTPNVLVIDVMGELKFWWGVADVAYVGGSMGKRGGQNMMEPAGFGVPVSFGPNTRNFREVVEQLLGSEAAVQVSNESELGEFVSQCLTDPDWAKSIGGRGRDVVLKNQGATHQTLGALEGLMSRSRRKPGLIGFSHLQNWFV